MQALKLRGVRFVHAGSQARALDGIDLDIAKGEFVTLLGANGSGKSTLCMLANGLVPHAVPGTFEGTAEVFGLDVSKYPVTVLATRVGMVFQEPESQLFCMSVEEEVAFGPENLAVPKDEIRARVEWALETVGMNGYNDRSPMTLSGGQKQRIAIAAALAMHPPMIVLDEPAYALDPIGRVELFSLLKRLKEQHGMTVLLAERDPEEAAVYSDRVVLMSKGKVVASGTPRETLLDVTRLRDIGIDPPQVATVSALINERLPRQAMSSITIEEAEVAVSRLLSTRPRSISR